MHKENIIEYKEFTTDKGEKKNKMKGPQSGIRLKNGYIFQNNLDLLIVLNLCLLL